MDIPKNWQLRDPRNPDHIRAALALIQRLSGIVITQQTATTLKNLGISTSNRRIWKRLGKHRGVIGGFYFLEEGLRYPDCLIVRCEDCNIPLQIRAESNTKAAKLCCFCAVDQLLKGYWSST